MNSCTSASVPIAARTASPSPRRRSGPELTSRPAMTRRNPVPRPPNNGECNNPMPMAIGEAIRTPHRCMPKSVLTSVSGKRSHQARTPMRLVTPPARPSQGARSPLSILRLNAHTKAPPSNNRTPIPRNPLPTQPANAVSCESPQAFSIELSLASNDSRRVTHVSATSW